MVCDIITDVVTTQPDMEVVGQLPDRLVLLSTTDQTRADVVVLGLKDSALPTDCEQLFTAHPQIRVLGIAADGRRAFLYELRPQQVSLGEVSPQGLIDAIRAAVGAQDG